MFRSSHSSSSSFSGPVHRSRSVSTLSTRHQQKYPADHLSKIRDHELKTNLEAKVDRLSRSLTRPTRDENSLRSRVHRSSSFGRHHQQDVGSNDWYQASLNLSNLSDRTGHRHKTQPPYAPENLSASSTALQQKATRLLLKDAFDCNIQPTGRSFDRIASMLEQLRREDAGTSGGRVMTTTVVSQHDGPPSSVRAELDSFAALISKLSPGSAAGLSRRQTSARSDVDDFWTRLAQTRNDLPNLETLVGKTFGSPHHSSSRSVSVEPVFIFYDKKPTSRRDEVLAFVTSDTADYKRSDPIAEMAIKWAQKRREKIENELHRGREHEDHPRYRQNHLRTARDEDEYFHLDELEPSSATVIHTLPTTRYQRSATVDLHRTSSREPSVRSYTRSESASVTGLHQPRTDEQLTGYWQPTRTYSVRPPMSAARQRARSVLAKHGRRLRRD